MQFKRIAMAVTSAVSLTGYVGISCAADNPDDQSRDAPQKVYITGSSVKQIAGETSLPVQILTKKDIEHTGATTAAELLNAVSSSSNAGAYSPTTSMYGGDAQSSPSLRGLGAERTLVLLNGRRVANNAFSGSGVDIDTIPISALERVEILKDGASAIYGADAVAGVINFILKKDFHGVEATVYGDASQHGGASGSSATLSGGIGDLTDDKYNVFASVDLRQNQPLNAAARSYTSSQLLPANYGPAAGKLLFPNYVGYPGRAYTASGAWGNPTDPNCTQPNQYSDGYGGCNYNFATLGYVLPKDKKISAISKLTYRPNGETEFYVEAGLSQNTYRLVSTPTFTIGENNTAAGNFPGRTAFTLSPGNPFYPTQWATDQGVNGEPIGFQSSLNELGASVIETTNKQARIVAGINGTIAGWDYDTAFQFNRAASKQIFLGDMIYTAKFYDLVQSGHYNPFGLQTPGDLALLKATQFNGEFKNAFAITKTWDGRISRPLFKLPAGSVDVALGAQLMDERLSQIYSPELTTGQLMNWGGAAPPANPKPVTVKSLSAEANIPVLKSLELNVSARDDSYSNFGNTLNPKVSFLWKPVAEVLIVRGSWGTGFRAPTLSDIGTPATFGYNSQPIPDPVRCPGNVAQVAATSAYDCTTPYQSLLYGNPDLQPEKSRQSTIGFVFEPIKEFSLGVNMFQINLRNVISVGGLPTNLAFDPATASQYSFLLVRDPATATATLPGEILYVKNPSLNIGRWNSRGSDLDMHYGIPSTQLGNFSVDLHGTYAEKFDQSLGITPTTSSVGVSGGVSRWQHYLTLNWVKDGWDVTFAQNFKSGYRDENSYSGFYNLTIPGYPRISSYTLYDLTAAYTVTKKWQIGGGIKNAFDHAPPFTNTYSGYGYDPRYADLRGRTFWMSTTYSFN
ncbi:TonB-dependent receptor [Sapientia aquatica]|uniref:TonB-dependent receptor n=1 Tax=Sapientia aquatica TaxID=1549640 RepID=A0A4R5VPU8_9BURK|nr:TonB-dependent receptor [Sapientia aquatica]TDK60444.1 TonB-dependent receptor [Sapientia aquatica]